MEYNHGRIPKHLAPVPLFSGAKLSVVPVKTKQTSWQSLYWEPKNVSLETGQVVFPPGLCRKEFHVDKFIQGMREKRNVSQYSSNLFVILIG